MIDKLVFFNAVLFPLCSKGELLFAFLFGLGDGDEIGAYTAGITDFIGNTIFSESKMSLRFLKR